MTLVELKARVYDLLVQKQNIEAELNRVNNLIANYKEPDGKEEVQKV